MCQRQILAAPAGTDDNQALDNRNSGENPIGIDVNAPAVIASPSIENNEPSLIARAETETAKDSSTISSKGSTKGSTTGSVQIGGGTSSDGKSTEDKTAKDKKREAFIKARSAKLQKENLERYEALKKKGVPEYQEWDLNDIGGPNVA